MNFDVCTKEIGKYLKGEHTNRFRIRRLEISISKRFVGSIEERV